MPKTNSSQKKASKSKRFVPFAKGFHLPLQAEKRKAIGFEGCSLPKEYADHSKPGKLFFKPLPRATSIDDWLAQNTEEAQPYSQYVDRCLWFSKKKDPSMLQRFVPSGQTILEKYPKSKIYIAKVGDFSSSDLIFKLLVTYVQTYLCLPVKIMESYSIEENSGQLFFVVNSSHKHSGRSHPRTKSNVLHTRCNAETNHLQIRIDSILPKMWDNLPDDALCVIALTNYDLYAEETDLFCAGMAAGPNRVGVFSVFRYQPALSFSQELWYDINMSNKVKKEDSENLMLQRSCKLVVHEIGHILGIRHCTYFSCCMNGSGHLQEDFSQPMMLCPVDLHKLQTLIGFDVEERYKSLLIFYQKHCMKEEACWTKRRLEFIQSD